MQITILDHRGCARSGAEYKGEKSGDQDDEMCVVIKQTQLNVASPAFKELASTVLAVSSSLFFCLIFVGIILFWHYFIYSLVFLVACRFSLLSDPILKLFYLHLGAEGDACSVCGRCIVVELQCFDLL